MDILSDCTRHGYVYLIWAEKTPRYKVGKSSNPERRLKQLRQQSCYPLTLIAQQYFENVLAHELRIHKLLNEFRVHGEWFELPDWVLQYTNDWLHDPSCRKIVKSRSAKILIYRKGVNEPSIWDRKTHVLANVPVSLKVPPTIPEIQRAVILLGHVAKGRKLALKTKKQLHSLVGCTPTEGEAALWKKSLKELL